MNIEITETRDTIPMDISLLADPSEEMTSICETGWISEGAAHIEPVNNSVLIFFGRCYTQIDFGAIV